MTTTTPPEHQAPTDPSTTTASRSRTGLWITIAVLAVALLALGAWVVVDWTSTSSSEVPDDIEALIDDYLAAWEAQDEAAMRALVTTDFVVNEYYYQASIDRTFLTSTITDDLEGVVNVGFSPNRMWTTEQVGEPIIVGEGPWFVAIGENWILDTSRADGMAHYVIVEENGELKIANHYWAGEEYRTD